MPIALDDMNAAKEIQKKALAILDDSRLRDAIQSNVQWETESLREQTAFWRFAFEAFQWLELYLIRLYFF